MCQFLELDPLSIPVATILKPFKVTKLTSNDVRKRQFKADKDFIIKQFYWDELVRYNENNPQRTLRI